MVDDLSYQKGTFISKLNPESPPFLPSSYYQHIQEVSQPKFTSENQSNHLHIEPITNGHQDNENYHSTTIHSIEPTEYTSSKSHYIQETTPNHQQSTITTSHIEPVNINQHEFDQSLTELQPTSSLPDVIPETLEQNSDHSNRQTEPDDILGNKSILKQTITPGTSDTRPTRNTLATVSYQLFLIDNSTSDSRLIETVTNESFFVGEYDILPAIDISIQLMDRGEYAIIDSDVRHCYGENGCEEKQIPPITTTNSYRMKIDLQFHDWKYPVEIQTLSINERLSWGDKKRQRGNFSYRQKEYATALHCYQNALKFLDTTEYPLLEEDEDQSSILINRYIQVQNNLAQVYLLNNQYEQCLNAIEQVLKYDINNIKALFRQAKALIDLGNYDHAIQPLKLLLQNPSHEIEKDKVKEMLNLCETKLAKYQKNEKEIYKRMFQSKPPPPPSSTTTTNENPKEIKNNWWTYVAMSSAVLAAIGLAAVIKYR